MNIITNVRFKDFDGVVLYFLGSIVSRKFVRTHPV